MSKYLDNINDPNDIKNLDITELESLSGEIKEFIIENVINTGGHLASSLGVVDLTLALHYVFDSPTDKLLFDVGHQAYAHKIICGRRDKFHTLRQYNGISGFLKPHESKHDAFAAGHCSTSISAGLGMVRARDLSGKDYNVVSIIGDGAMTAGLAYEGLNDAGHAKRKFIIVLNDNAMSIAENVGALHNNLSGLRANSKYINFKIGTATFLKKIPLIGKGLYNFIDTTKRKIKYLFVKGVWFEELGFTYIGIVDGHDIKSTISALNNAKNADKPVVVHIHTKKGSGYKPAELDPEGFHGISAKCAEKSDKPSNSQIFGEKLLSLAQKNDKIIAVSAAMPKGTGLDCFKEKLPERFFDVGIAEQHGVTMSAGLASQGYIPVFAVYSSFLQRGYDQVVHDVCIQNLPVIFAIDRAGLVGQDGETHHGVYDIAYLSHIPNITILSPSCACEFESMLEFAISLKSPVAIRYPRGCFDRKNNCNITPIQNWECIEEPKDVTVIAIGNHVSTAIKAMEKTEFGLYNAKTIKPLDENALDYIAKKSKHIITIEDHSIIGGFGSLVESYYNQKGKNLYITKMGIPDRFVTHGKVCELNQEIHLTTEDLVDRINSLK